MGNGHGSSIIGQLPVGKPQWGERLEAIFNEQLSQDVRSNMQLTVWHLVGQLYAPKGATQGFMYLTPGEDICSMIEWMIGWVNEWLIDCINEQTKEWKKDPRKEATREWMNEWISKGTNKRKNKGLHGQKIRQTDRRTERQMNAWLIKKGGGTAGDGLACIARAMSSSALRFPWGPDPSPRMFSMILQHTQCGCQLVTHMQQVTLHLRVSDPIFQTDFSGEYIKPELHWWL